VKTNRGGGEPTIHRAKWRWLRWRPLCKLFASQPLLAVTAVGLGYSETAGGGRRDGRLLGHANLSQTSTYLNPTAIGLQESMRKLDETRAARKVVANGAVCDPRPGCKDDSRRPDNLLIH
jgi:hypothetical protein